VATDGWGVDDGWYDTSGTWHAAPQATLTAIAETMGRSDASPSSPPGRPVWVVRPGQDEHLSSPCHVVLEDGEDLGELVHLPHHLPLGIHDLVPADGGPTTALIVSPRRCHLPDDLRTWGVTMQIPTTRSRSSWGIGDLGDVATMAQWVQEQCGGAVGLSPLHAGSPVSPLQPSPYYPSSRRWRSPLLLRVELVPGAAQVPALSELAQEAHQLLDDPIVDRDRSWDVKRQALEHLWLRMGDAERERLSRWRADQGAPLEGWARYCALAEVHGSSWTTWPDELRRPETRAVAEAVAALTERVAFHAWLQQLLEDQLEAAHTTGVRLIQDLAIGVDPSGADAWLLQDLLALGTSVGAPPDDFAPDGQSWGLPPFIPWRLRDVGYRPFADLLRASMVHDGGLRIDHVMGMSRLFWVPPGGTPADGTYVRFAGREMLDVVAMESARARAVVVGEDLGTVEEEFRRDLQDTRVLSTRLVWFEDVPPSAYPTDALAMVTTHDLPTIAGVTTGADDAELAELGRPAPPDASAGVRRRLEALVPDAATRPVAEVAAAVHEQLGSGPSRLVLATLEDLCGVTQRPNVPGTSDERPNWSCALPLTLDDLTADAAVLLSTDALRRTRDRAR
jgi:4-alpha-glucanotransferase